MILPLAACQYCSILALLPSFRGKVPFESASPGSCFGCFRRSIGCSFKPRQNMNRGGSSTKKIKVKTTLTDRRRFLEQLKYGSIGFFSTNTYTSGLSESKRVVRADDTDRKQVRARTLAAFINDGSLQTDSKFQKGVTRSFMSVRNFFGPS